MVIYMSEASKNHEHHHHDENESKTHAHTESHGHNHGHGHHGPDPFLNPSKFFMWRYAFRNYLRRRVYYKELMKKLNLNGSEQVLDFGSGVGTLAKKIAPKVQKVSGKLVCVDVSPKLLEYTKNQLKKYSNVEFLLGEVFKQNLPEKSFDFIASTWVLHHLEREELEKTINSFASLIKESGKIFIIEFPDGFEHAHRVHSLIPVADIVESFHSKGFSSKVLLRKEGGVLYEFTK